MERTSPTVNVHDYLNQPLTIGNRTIENRLTLAPMAVLGNVAHREMIARYGGCGLMFMEMCNARLVPHENRQMSMTFKWRDEELNKLVCQLFGSEPGIMAKAAVRIEQEGFFGVDINFGCSVSAICKKNCGAALLKDPDQALAIVDAVRKAVSIPVFAKFRTGWSPDPGPAVALAKGFENAGADALTFHPRVAPDRRGRAPRWDHIRLVKEAVSIPVFGNGNVFDQEDCRKMIDMTHCDGVALGRIAVVKPWIFSVITKGFVPDEALYQRHLFDFIDCLESHFEAKTALRLFKKSAIYYAANYTYGHAIWTRLIKADHPDQVRENIRKLYELPPELSKSPNMNLML
ncbi:MAG: tRNA-dihydrouridine synthase family protein [Proteobacteria bacterium]|nr:tRNA-dihydrouridine synthase family protein [Pseudomonadota bacterium]